MRRAGIILSASLALVLATATSAAATTATKSGTQLTITGEPGEASDLVLSYFYDGTYKYDVFEQGAGLGLTSPDASCVPNGSGSPPELTCVDDSLTTGTLDMGDGSDKVCACGAIPLTMSLTILGGKGRDHLTGGQAPEVIEGGGGNDVIFGDGSALDVLKGDGGRDKLLGDDYGPDKIDAKDGQRDRKIDCGEGDDPNARYDHGLDPAPIDC